MLTDFAGRKLPVVSGTSGIGMEAARLVLSRGGSVVVVGHRPQKADTALADLSKIGHATAVTADIARSDGLVPRLTRLEDEHRDVDRLATGTRLSKPTFGA